MLHESLRIVDISAVLVTTGVLGIGGHLFATLLENTEGFIWARSQLLQDH